MFLQDSQCDFQLKTVEKRGKSVIATVSVAEEQAGYFLVYLCQQDYRGVDFSCTPTAEGCLVEIQFPIGFFEF
jgi:hypothetical protein